MSIIKEVTLQKIVAHDFRYDTRILSCVFKTVTVTKVRIKYREGGRNLCVFVLTVEDKS